MCKRFSFLVKLKEYNHIHVCDTREKIHTSYPSWSLVLVSEDLHNQIHLQEDYQRTLKFFLKKHIFGIFPMLFCFKVFCEGKVSDMCNARSSLFIYIY